MEEIRKQFSRLSPADKIRQDTVSNQADMVKGKLNAAYTSDKTGLFLDKVILYKEIAEVLAEKGFDVCIYRGVNMNDSWTEISWENSKEGKPGEVREI